MAVVKTSVLGRLVPGVCAWCLVLLLLGCESKLNAHNRDRIIEGMNPRQVQDILGPPTATRPLNVYGNTGVTDIWKDGDREIDVNFVNDHATSVISSGF